MDDQNRSNEAPSADISPIDFAALRPSADRERFNRTAMQLANEMSTVVNARDGGAYQLFATIVRWQRRIGFAAAAVVILAGGALIATAIVGATPAPPPAVSNFAAAGLPPRLTDWARTNYRPTALDLIAVFDARSPLSLVP